MAKLTISRGVTVNIGNYESARVDLSIETDLDKLDPNVDDLDAALEHVDEWLKNTLRHEVTKIQKAAGVLGNPDRFFGK